VPNTTTLAERYRDLFEGALLGIYVSQPDGRLVACNAAFARLLGFESIAHAIGASMSDVYSNPPEREAFVGRVREEGRIEHHRGRLRRCDGRFIDVIETVVGEFDAGGALTELRGFMIDISASVEAERAALERERRLEERLAQSERIETVGRLAGGIAHDFNNLLTAILGYTELLLSNRAGDDAERADLEEIQKAGTRAASLTQQLLAFSRKQVLIPKDVDLNQAVTDLQSMLARLIREDITLECDLSAAPAVIRIDPTQVEQVLLNLVLNARDALPAGGEIRLEVARVPRSQVELPPELQPATTDYVRLRVIDNGVGIPAEARSHLFEPFFTTKGIGKGTGLGLASVYGIVRQSNGFITVDTEPGKGTVFTMHFPAVSSVPSKVRKRSTLAAPTAGGETILLVEDEDAVRVIVAEILRRQGYHVLEAASPGAACDVFDSRASEIDLLLTDIVMPGMNGPALAQRLIGQRPDLRVLFMSGYAEMATPLDPRNPHVGFLTKPFQSSALTSKVQDMLSRAGGTRASSSLTSGM
jgi:two-component system, cell cycle sensor histidine kinase and response regulator CckA